MNLICVYWSLNWIFEELKKHVLGIFGQLILCQIQIFKINRYLNGLIQLFKINVIHSYLIDSSCAYFLKHLGDQTIDYDLPLYQLYGF